MKTPPLFVIDPAPTVRWPVKVSLPADGQPEGAEFVFEADIRVYSEEEFEALLSDRPSADTASTLVPILDDNALVLPKIITGWRGVVRPDGSVVPIDALPALLTGPYGRPLSVALFRAIGEVRFGIRPDILGATEGNSAPPSGAGSTAAE